ncbi:MAG TPA: hypothetical protein VNE39_07115 [Planctomycetota bacterium]|nr:hypothetical protein [Planctomycetota bacterium]
MTIASNTDWFHEAKWGVFTILSYLGSTWCGGQEPRFGDDLAAAYTRYVTSKGGVVTWDAPILKSGLIPQPFVAQLTAVGRAIRT